MKQEVVEEFEWDKKKIIIGLVLLIALSVGAVGLKDHFFGASKSILGESNIPKSSELEKPDVKSPNVNIQTEIVPRIEEIKKTIGSLDAKDVASSSPQIQKVLNDIQGIKNLPANEAKQACLKLCSGI